MTEREKLKLIASGKSLEINRLAFDEVKHTSFVEGALFAWDFLKSEDREKIEKTLCEVSSGEKEEK